MRTVTVDCRREKGTFSSMFNFCVGAGRAHEMLRKAPLDQLAALHEECGFRYLRFHGILCDEMGVYSEDAAGNPVFNFQYVDMVCDEILRIGMKPFVELSFMPEALRSGEHRVFWWKANVTPPNNLSRWSLLVRKLAEHFVIRYGIGEVASWYFEVWNEPNHIDFFTRKIGDYFQMYDASAGALKSVSDRLRVGGPATAGSAWVGELIGHCAAEGVPLDFITTHTYGVIGAFDEFGVRQLYLDKNQNCIIDSVKKVHNQIACSEMPDLELHYTEWSASYSSRDPVHDSYFAPSYILYQLKRLTPYAASMSYWTFTDIFEEAGVAGTPFHGGFGLVNLQSLRKPAYFAYAFLNRMGKTELQCGDENAIACRDDSGNVQLLLWDYRQPKQDCPNQQYFAQDRPPEQLGETHAEIAGLPAGRYRVRRYQVGYGISDVYTEYLRNGSPDLASRKELEKLRTACASEAVSDEVIAVGEGESVSVTFSRRMYDCSLLTAEPLPPETGAGCGPVFHKKGS